MNAFRVRFIYFSIIFGASIWFTVSFLFLLYQRSEYTKTKRHIDDLHEPSTNLRDVIVPLSTGTDGTSSREVRRTWIANYETIPESSDPKGPGEYGSEVKVNKTFLKAVKEGYKEHGFNIFVSDMMSYHRRLPDTRSKA